MSGLRVDMLPARHGDGLWVEWGETPHRHRMIVDGGTKAAFADLRRRLETLDGDDRRVDLLVITHIDLDHIDAPIELLRSSVPGVTFGDVWFNDFHHLDPSARLAEADGEPGTADRGGLQGEFLGALLRYRELPWNAAFGGEPVVVPARGALPRVELPGGLVLTLLSPTGPKLEQLRPVWQEAVEEADMSPGDRARALRLLEERMGPAERGGPPRFGSDRSEANGSSIAFIAEHDGERWLFAGDAHDDVLRSGIRRYAGPGGLPVRLDGFKVPHHGSANNVSPGLLELVDCDRFLVSTNGAYFKHPDRECIDLLVGSTARPVLEFNYLTSFTEPWRDRDDVETVYRYDADHHPLDDGAGDERSMSDAPALAPTGAQPPADLLEAPASDLAVRVIHGSLDRADSAVIVGHYEATPLSGAEGYIDGRFGGRLTDRHTRDEYPDRIGTHVFVAAPPRVRPAGGVVVVGLGEYGELTPLTLAETIRRALVAHALDVADLDTTAWPDDVVDLAISSVLVGATGEQGMSVRSAARAIVKGVAEANRTLLHEDRVPRSRYVQLDLWERRAPEAELALLALTGGAASVDAARDVDALEPDALPRHVLVDPSLHVSGGNLVHSIAGEGEQRPWRRLRVTAADGLAADGATGDGATGDGSVGDAAVGQGVRERPYLRLEFATDARRAGVGHGVQDVEQERLRRLLRSCAQLTEPGHELYTTLFELLLPQEVKWDLQSAADIQLEVDDRTADIPWEMLAARNPRREEREALALRAPFTRQLRVPPSARLHRAREARTLVIGNPPAGPRWPTLPGAHHEAHAVIATLEQAGVPDPWIDAKVFEPGTPATDEVAAEIEAALFKHEYRIIHVAGHGAYDGDDPTRTGIVIGDGAFLTAKVLGCLPAVPDLVFLNCCHLGTVSAAHDGANPAAARFHQLGASLALELIRAGVRAVVAAGWAVDDAGAAAFATTFYEQMTRADATFADAVYAARRAAHRAAPGSSTWGAYQCYGDGGLRLGIRRTSWVPPAPATTRELLRRLEVLVDRVESRGGSGSEEELAADRDELKILIATARERGWIDGRDGAVVGEQLANAHAELGNFELAVEWYDQALRHRSGAATLRAVEQRANLRDRQAGELMRTGDAADARRAAELAALAEDDIQLLMGISGTAERASLLAGHYKRQAVVHTGPRRGATVRTAADCYRAAYEHSAAVDGEAAADPYGFVNYVQLEEIRARLQARWPSRVTADDRRLLRRMRDALQRAAASTKDFWKVVGVADAELALALSGRGLPARPERLAARYEEAFTDRSTVRERSSPVEHLQCLAALHPDPADAAALWWMVGRLTGAPGA